MDHFSSRSDPVLEDYRTLLNAVSDGSRSLADSVCNVFWSQYTKTFFVVTNGSIFYNLGSVHTQIGILYSR